MKTILIADDEEAIRGLMIATLRNTDSYSLLTAGDSVTTIQRITAAVPVPVFLDVLLA